MEHGIWITIALIWALIVVVVGFGVSVIYLMMIRKR